MDDAYALVLAGDHVRDDYVRLLGRIGLSARSYARVPDTVIGMPARAPTVAVLEVEDGGCGFLHELRDRYGPGMPAVLVSAARTTPDDVVAGLLIGADDYAAESMDAEEFLARVRRLIERSRSLRLTTDLRPLSLLTGRERQVLALTSEGLSQKQVAASLGISIKTVGAHMQSLLVKLGVHTRIEAVALAVRAGEDD